tara:strand:+ start:1084 stop:2340 length:1257 start_codon:yes stop_codon:yes gene_type:complete
MNKLIKVMTISDHPGIPSGVGTQTRYVIEALLKTGKFSVVSLGGAIKHPNYERQTVDGYPPELWTVIPIDGYGSPMEIRGAISAEKPDILYFMTDPRFYRWLWDMEDEIRSLVPLVYYHVWDNYPPPVYNEVYYKSTDVIATISRVTSDIVQIVSPEVEEHYIPHAVDDKLFCPKDNKEVREIRERITDGDPDRFVVFWNNRNARRKMPGSLMMWFKKFLENTGANATLVMHTDLKDVHGQPLDYLATNMGYDTGEIVFSQEKMDAKDLANLYNAVDVTINISDAEGFGLATLESLSCGVPIIVNMTGGLQEQVTDGEEFFGIGLNPPSKALVGSQEVPYIYEDRLAADQVVEALTQMYDLSREERKEIGLKGREHVLKNYNFKDFNKKWVDLMLKVHEERGSYGNRKKYNPWEFFKL